MQNSKHFYRVGGLVFSLDMPDFSESRHLSPFAVPECPPDVSAVLELTDELTVPTGAEELSRTPTKSVFLTEEGKVTVFFGQTDSKPILIVLRSGDRVTARLDPAHTDYINSGLAFELMDMPYTVIRHGGIFLHSSFIDADGGAVLFTGPKQIGKSTQAALWERLRGAKVVNGDRALFRRKDGVWYAWGSPYCGMSDICLNAALPLKAVVILSQAAESTARRADIRRAMAAMLDGCSFDTRDEDQVDAASEICGEIITEVPFYTLACRADESAVTALEKIL